MEKESITYWKKNMSFDIELNGFNIRIDADETVGGNNSGPRPKALMEAALAGCTGMDVISIMNKMKLDVEDFKIKINSKLSDEHPKKYESMHITYIVKGNNLNKDKIEKAVNLSQDKYCGVSAVYKKAMNITYDIIIE